MRTDARVEDLLRELAPRVLGALVRRYGDFDACEDAVQEALLAAAVQWPDQGIPVNPAGWLIAVAARRMADQVRGEVARRRREEAAGLLALMLLTDARRPARTGPDGGLIPLAEQDRGRWDQGAIREGVALITAALARTPLGPYQLQAAIAAVHAEAARAEETDWPQILALYALLERVAPGPMVTLNRAVAVAMPQGPRAGLDLLTALDADGRLAGHHRLDAVRAHLLEMGGDAEDSERMSQAHAFPPEPVAPWAEVAPDAPPHMTLAAFLAYPGGDGYRYELVEGVLVRMVGSRDRALRITNRLYIALGPYVAAHGLGETRGADAVYDFEHTGQKDTGLLPAISFYSASREPLVDPDAAYPFAPDLAVEVASPHQYRPGMAAKAERYLAGGTALVWVVWPKRREVDVWRSGDSAPATLGAGDVLDGENVVPGFTYPVAALFT